MIVRVLTGWFGRLLCLGGLMAVAGCASTEQYGENVQTELSPTKARIYVMRTARFIGDGTAVEISMSGIQRRTGRDYSHIIGLLGPKSYLCWDAPPGEVFLSIAEGELGNKKELSLEGGETYYLRVTFGGGYVAPEYGLELLTDTEGKALLKKCKPPNKI